MKHSSPVVRSLAAAVVLSCCAAFPAANWAQSTSKGEQWIHVRVESKEDKGETVRVNVPVEMAVKVLPAIKQERLHEGKVRIDNAHLEDVDLRALLDAVRTAKDGEYVTIQDKENDVRIAKSAGYLYIHVSDKEHPAKAKKTEAGKEAPAKAAVARESRVEIKIPMKVVDALFSAGKDELDVLAALQALAANGDTELVSVKDEENTVRIWIDSKNSTD